jgi:hypothetical protein
MIRHTFSYVMYSHLEDMLMFVSHCHMHVTMTYSPRRHDVHSYMPFRCWLVYLGETEMLLTIHLRFSNRTIWSTLHTVSSYKKLDSPIMFRNWLYNNLNVLKYMDSVLAMNILYNHCLYSITAYHKMLLAVIETFVNLYL